jgi:prolyl-tRNA synthetase
MREFLMKDLYSFNVSEEEHEKFYEEAVKAYLRIFDRLGIGEYTYRTFADGGPFSDFSDEFQVVCEAGEDTIYVDKEKEIALNGEVYKDEIIEKLGLDKTRLEKLSASEVGNTFSLGTKYSEALDCTFTDSDEQVKPCVMGCYGIGPGRTMGVIAELLSDEKGLVWPAQIAPYHVYLVSIGNDEQVAEVSNKIYNDLWEAGVEVLLDDRAGSAGSKFHDADLLGIPVRLVVSKRLNEAGEVELKLRKDELANNYALDDIVNQVKKIIS